MYSASAEPTPDRHDLPQAYLILFRVQVVLLAFVLWAIGTTTPGSWLAARTPDAATSVHAAHR
jgi:hypothetical protein